MNFTLIRIGAQLYSIMMLIVQVLNVHVLRLTFFLGEIRRNRVILEKVFLVCVKKSEVDERNALGIRRMS